MSVAAQLAAILESIKLADSLYQLGGDLVTFMRQRHPELNTQPVADEGEAMDQARAAALAAAEKK